MTTATAEATLLKTREEIEQLNSREYADYLRPLVEEAVKNGGHVKFADRCYQVGRRKSMRVWRTAIDYPGDWRPAAEKSVLTLLRQAGVRKEGRYATGYCHRWVLDLFYAALAENSNSPVAPVLQKLELEDAERFPSRADLGEILHGAHLAPPARKAALSSELPPPLRPQAFEPVLVGEVVEEAERGLSIATELLDAYLNRDDERMMRLVIDVEELEAREP